MASFVDAQDDALRNVVPDRLRRDKMRAQLGRKCYGRPSWHVVLAEPLTAYQYHLIGQVVAEAERRSRVREAEGGIGPSA